MMSKTILVTGAAGFIGSHVTQALLARGDRVFGLDNLNDYYAPQRKQANLAEIEKAVSPGERFSGSGTTIIAAESVGRICYAMELSLPTYVDVAITFLLNPNLGVISPKKGWSPQCTKG